MFLVSRSLQTALPLRAPHEIKIKITITIKRVVGLRAISLQHQHDLPMRAGGHYGFVGFGGAGQGELAADDGVEGTSFEAGLEVAMDGGQLFGRGIGEHDAADIGFARHGVARIDLDGAAAADDGDASARREEGEVVAEVEIGEHLEDDIDAASAGGFADLVEVAEVVVIEDGIGAVFAQEEEAAFAAAGGEDGESGGLGELDGREADAAGAAVDEDDLAGFGRGPAEEGVMSGDVRDAEGGAFGKAGRRRGGDGLARLRTGTARRRCR